MMSFLRSIRSTNRTKVLDLERRMDEVNEKVAGLEKELEAATAAAAALSICVTSIVLAIRDLSSDVQLVSEVISVLSGKKKDPLKKMLSTQSKKDDDDYIN